MNPRKRLVVMLTTLASAMVGVTVFLGALDPSKPLSPGSLPIESIIIAARRAVIENVNIDSQRWLGVDVVTRRVDSGTGPMLTAVPSDEVWHFHVDPNGIPLRGERWTRQIMAAQPGRILIVVQATNLNTPLSTRQTVGVRALVSWLNAVLAPSGTGIPVHMPDAAS